MAWFPTLKGSWPWPWHWILILRNIVHHSSTSTYMPNFIEIKVIYEDGRTYIRTYICMYAQTDGYLRPALLGRLCRRVDLKYCLNTYNWVYSEPPCRIGWKSSKVHTVQPCRFRLRSCAQLWPKCLSPASVNCHSNTKTNMHDHQRQQNTTIMRCLLHQCVHNN